MDEQSFEFFGKRVSRAVGHHAPKSILTAMLTPHEDSYTPNPKQWIKKQTVTQLRQAFHNTAARQVAEMACGIRPYHTPIFDARGRL